MAFLDEEGLQYYTGKIQSEIGKKQNSVFSDGSPDIRIKEVTVSEYNSLSNEEKQLPILYLVYGDSSLIANTQETQNSIAGIATLEETSEQVAILDHLESSFALTYAK